MFIYFINQPFQKRLSQNKYHPFQKRLSQNKYHPFQKCGVNTNITLFKNVESTQISKDLAQPFPKVVTRNQMHRHLKLN